MQSWTLADGQTFEARYLFVLGGNVLMESGEGTQKKIGIERFSADDREFFELENLPEFKIGFRRKSTLLGYSDRFDTGGLPVVNLNTFGVRIEKRSAGDYNHEVNIEVFAVGAQLHHNDKYILLDRQTSSFVPSKMNKHSHEFWSPKTIGLEEYSIRSNETRGKKYDTYLIILTDKRGKVIAMKSPSKWLLENLENLKKLPVGSFMDSTCTRVYPGRPKAVKY